MLTILLARNLNPHIDIIARANTSSSVGKMYRAGADYVMSLSAVGGQILARIIEKGSFQDTVLLSDNVLLARFSVARIKAGEPDYRGFRHAHQDRLYDYRNQRGRTVQGKSRPI